MSAWGGCVWGLRSWQVGDIPWTLLSTGVGTVCSSRLSQILGMYGHCCVHSHVAGTLSNQPTNKQTKNVVCCFSFSSLFLKFITSACLRGGQRLSLLSTLLLWGLASRLGFKPTPVLRWSTALSSIGTVNKQRTGVNTVSLLSLLDLPSAFGTIHHSCLLSWPFSISRSIFSLFHLLPVWSNSTCLNQWVYIFSTGPSTRCTHRALSFVPSLFALCTLPFSATEHPPLTATSQFLLRQAALQIRSSLTAPRRYHKITSMHLRYTDKDAQQATPRFG